MPNRNDHDEDIFSDDELGLSSEKLNDYVTEDETDIISSQPLGVQTMDHGNGVLTYNGRKFAVNLIWLTLEEAHEQRDINARAKQFSADFFCSRSLVSQVGFGSLEKDHRMGMASAAAMAADVLVGEWHGVFVADNGWHYIAVHSDTIAPMGDKFFESEEDAYNHFILQSEALKWPRTYVPAAWNFPSNDSEISYDKLVDDIATTTLKPVSLDALFSGKTNKNIAFIVAGLFIAFLFLSMFSKNILTNFIPEQQKVVRPGLDISDILSAPPQIPEERIDPMSQAIENFNLPNPTKVAQNCIENFDELMISIPGWNLKTMRCRNNFAEALWDRGVGGLDNIKSHINDFPFGVGTTFGSRGDFLASRVVGNLSKFDEKAEFASREKVLVMLNDRFGSLGRLDVRDVMPASQQDNRRRPTSARAGRFNENAKNESEENRVITIQDLPSLLVTYQTNTSISRMGNKLNVPGLRINLIEWDILRGTWTYNMQVFLSPKI